MKKEKSLSERDSAASEFASLNDILDNLFYFCNPTSVRIHALTSIGEEHKGSLKCFHPPPPQFE